MKTLKTIFIASFMMAAVGVSAQNVKLTSIFILQYFPLEIKVFVLS